MKMEHNSVYRRKIFLFVSLCTISLPSPYRVSLPPWQCHRSAGVSASVCGFIRALTRLCAYGPDYQTVGKFQLQCSWMKIPLVNLDTHRNALAQWRGCEGVRGRGEESVDGQVIGGGKCMKKDQSNQKRERWKTLREIRHSHVKLCSTSAETLLKYEFISMSVNLNLIHE